jgi:hypothetical protein
MIGVENKNFYVADEAQKMRGVPKLYNQLNLVSLNLGI